MGRAPCYAPAMTSQLTVHGFETSNNMKVRVALGYKGLAYAFETIDPADRAGIVRLSGQHLTPVLVHGDVVLFDSAAILRYLDANFPDTPKLYGRSRDEQWAIEDWEMFGRTRLAGPMMEVVHTRVSGGAVSEALQADCQTRFDAAVTEVARALGEREWLVGEGLTAADVTIAAVLRRIRVGGLFATSDAAETLEPYVARVMAFDGAGRR